MRNNTTRRRRRVHRLGTLMVAAIIPLAACGGEDNGASGGSQADGGAEAVTMRFGAVAQAAMFPVYTAIAEDYFADRGIELELVPYPGFDALYQAYRAGEVDCGASGMPSTVDLISDGVPMKIFYGSNAVTNDVLVPVDSDIESFADLEGNRIGSFGGPQGSSANMFLAVARAYFDFDPVTEAELQYAAPPLLASGTQSGELAAFLSIDPVAAQLVADGTMRSIGDTGDIYEDEAGHKGYIGSYDCSEAFAAEHPEVLTGFIEAIRDAVGLLQESEEPWAQVLEEHYDITNPAVVQEMMERTVDRLPLEWGPEVIDEQMAFLEFLQEYGEDGFMDNIDPNAFTFEYLPEGD